jgi:hypothetical protein
MSVSVWNGLFQAKLSPDFVKANKAWVELLSKFAVSSSRRPSHHGNETPLPFHISVVFPIFQQSALNIQVKDRDEQFNFVDMKFWL